MFRTELSGRVVAEWALNLEDTPIATELRLDSLKTKLKIAPDSLDSSENQSRQQNMRNAGMKEGLEGKEPVGFFEDWISEVLGMQGD
ncbi:hypothetical protein PAMA_001988 [Pampus argenteus]